jgi:hypothetical protein
VEEESGNCQSKRKRKTRRKEPAAVEGRRVQRRSRCRI